ncbi:hypothetical protein CKM354_000580200 [Cercospora kikuchii]|uniref:Uncharacterized protein n=1 Tax=Cercospora kikuchii TaxID=84275 RepID=A0A9P3FHL1_9PEZI|nr:uncharacterized protein CKM354_000580200 [Cercospora kikuchii]GIZ42540.1 hypothetical protein CKM354_000580200 [Cercospora kikuchii]
MSSSGRTTASSSRSTATSTSSRTSIASATTSTSTTSTTLSTTTSVTRSASTTSAAVSTTTTTSGSSAQETTIGGVRIAFRKASTKRQTGGPVDLSAGYISKGFGSKGEHSYTENADDALVVMITAAQGGPIVQTGLNLITEGATTNVDLTALALVRNTEGQADQLLLGAAFPDVPPADGTQNSVQRAQGGTDVAQSAIWTVNLQTFEISAQWVNADGSKESLTLLTQDGDLFMTGNPSAFPGAQSLTAAASFPDPTAACALISNYEYVNGQCVEKCRTGLTRVPGTTICATPQISCPAGQQGVAGLCLCIDRTMQVFNGECVPMCNVSLKERRNATGQCGCRADMTRTLNTDVCQCPSGQEDSGTTCYCTANDQVLEGGSCTCRSTTATIVNGVCTEQSEAQDFKNVLLSFTLPSSRKRQATGGRVDLSYGYISADYRETGERYLTNDANNALSVSFEIPAGTTTAQQLNLVGSASPAQGSGIPTLALIVDTAVLNPGLPFGSYGGSRLNLGSSAATAPGSLPQDVDNSMAPGRAIGNEGKQFVAETAVWTVDSSTGNIDAYWIDDTGKKNRMMPVTNGDNLFFAPEAVYDQINATPLLIRAELPNTTAPPPPGGAADCRTGTVQCPACSDAINQCRAPDGTCVTRDEVGACGYNCFPGNEFAGPSPDCWKCPTGYFGKSQSGCTALPCPDPVNEFRNRTGCFTIPTCEPPQVYIGNGRCGRVISEGGWSTPKVSP